MEENQRIQDGLLNSAQEPERKSFLKRAFASRATVVALTAFVALAAGFFIGRLKSSGEEFVSPALPMNSFGKNGLGTSYPWKLPDMDSVNRYVDSLTKAGFREEAQQMRKSLNLTYAQASKINSIYLQRQEESKALTSQQMKELTDFREQTDTLIMNVLTPEERNKWKMDSEDKTKSGFDKLMETIKAPVGLSNKQVSQIKDIMDKYANQVSRAITNHEDMRHFNYIAVYDSEMAEIRTLLKPDQQVKWEQEFDSMGMNPHNNMKHK
jgi:hypothetical protein